MAISRRFYSTTLLLVACSLSFLISLSVSISVAPAQDFEITSVESGKRIYANLCSSCHGPAGGGTSNYDEPLFGDLPVQELATYIADTMPEEDPDSCVGNDATEVAEYIHGKFYSPEAQRNLNKPRIELSRLTVRQYRESIADLSAAFTKPDPMFGSDRGLQGDYFASRNRTEERRLAKQIDPSINFANGVPHFDVTDEYPGVEKLKNQANKMNEGFSAYWNGSVIAPETGTYKIIVESKNGFQLHLNNSSKPLIDRWVRSEEDTTHTEDIYLLAGRAYPLRIKFFSYTSPPAEICLLWQLPSGLETNIPESNLLPHSVSESLAISTPFPADDASAGYARGTSVSRQWDESTSSAAIATSNWIADRIWKLAKTKPSDEDRDSKVKHFCKTLVERAFVTRLSDEELHFFVTQHFENELPFTDQVKRVVILALKSPRFLFPALEKRNINFDIARNISLTLWDSLPDRKIYKLAADEKLSDAQTLEKEIKRMILDPRAKSKLNSFFRYWLKTESAANVDKDKTIYPDFDAELLADLKQSLNMYLDEVIWGERSDFRELFLADYLYINNRLSKFYGIPIADPESNGFFKAQADSGMRAGILTHPFLMAGLAYHKESSPIHRGVFVARNLLGRTLRQPPDDIEPLAEDFNPHLTTRQRVEHQTSETNCMSCHSVINPLGFSLEHFDAVGRFRKSDKQKPIDVASIYQTPSGENVDLKGARDLAQFLANNEMAQRSFVTQLFQHYTKQSPFAYGTAKVDQLHASFVLGEFNVRNLIAKIALSTVPNNATSQNAE